MPSEDLVDTRARKRERDKENQRLKRTRERDAFRDLERRNASLERQVEALSSASSGNIQHLLESVQLLRTRNAVLEERISRVNVFITGWAGSRPVDENVAVENGLPSI
jgi:hypothetical protein